MYNYKLYKEDIDNVLSSVDVNQFKNKAFLITGSTGLIGLHLIDVLMAIPTVKVIAIGRNKEMARGRLGEYFENPNFKFVEQDVLKPFPSELKADYVVPLASNTHPVAYAQYPVETMMINLKGVENALNFAHKCNATVLYPSTVEVYGNARNNEDFNEDYTGVLNLATARSCYTESKRAAEALCQSYLSEYGVKVKIARLSRVFGPTMKMDDSKVSSQFIKKAVASEDIILKSEGTQYFSYTYTSDAVSALLYILLDGEVGKAYNISCTQCNIHLRDFAQICAKYNNKSVIFDIPSETERKGYSIATKAILDNGRLLGIGFLPHYSIEDAVHRTIEILRQRHG